MIAAGSVVAAVQGLHLGNTNTFLSYQCLTHFLSKVIKCDPVSDSAHLKLGFEYIVMLCLMPSYQSDIDSVSVKVRICFHYAFLSSSAVSMHASNQDPWVTLQWAKSYFSF